MKPAYSPVFALWLFAPLVLGCAATHSQVEDEEEVDTTSEAVTIELSVEPAVSPRPVAHDTIKDAGPGTLLSVVDVRTARHDGFSRVVIELDGHGDDPGFIARYVDKPMHDPSGEIIELTGDAVLELYVTGWGYPTDVGIENAVPSPIETPTGGAVADVAAGGFFEGMAQFLIGVRGGGCPFTVTTLTNPTRVVIDVAD